MRSIRFVGISLLGTCLGLFAFAENASAGSIGLVPNGGCLSYASTEGTVYFCDRDLRSAGTGVIDPFLKLQRDQDQHDGTPSTYSSGWNTDAQKNDVPATNDMDQSHTNALLASDIGYATGPTGTGTYAVFTVDIDQQGAQNALGDILSLNQFELFNCDNDNKALTVTPGTAGSNCTSFFDLFAAGDWVNFDYRNHTGSGSGDIDVYIPSGVGFGTEWISLMDGWGCGITGLTCDTSNASTGLFPDNDGPQEWIRSGIVQTSTTSTTTTTDDTTTSGTVPEPASMLLLGAGLAASGYVRRRQNRRTCA